MKKLKIYMLTAIAATLTTLHAGDLIIKTSHHGVDETITKMEQIIHAKAKQGLSVFGVIDHQAGAAKAGLKMHPEKVILFGNPKLGTKLMQKDPQTGLDLPLRVLVYRAEDGSVKIAYHNPQEWQKGYRLEGCKLIGKMSEVLDKITTIAAK
jgi:uncharacterized protein (DUF302 family)